MSYTVEAKKAGPSIAWVVKEKYSTCIAAHNAAHQLTQSGLFDVVEVIAPAVDFAPLM
jgi:hypothetical protein